MNYDLLAAFDHPGVDPAAQQQAANLLSQQSQIQPPSLAGGAGLAEGRQEYISPQAPYVNPVNYAEAGGYPSNNQIAMDAFAAAQALQQQGRTTGFEASGVGGYLPGMNEPQAQAVLRRFGNRPIQVVVLMPQSTWQAMLFQKKLLVSAGKHGPTNRWPARLTAECLIR